MLWKSSQICILLGLLGCVALCDWCAGRMHMHPDSSGVTKNMVKTGSAITHAVL